MASSDNPLERFNAERAAEREQQLLQEIESLRNSLRTRDTLFSLLGHELRAPIFQLNGMLYMLREMAEGRVSGVALNPYIEDMEQRVKYLTGLLDNLLRWSLSQRDSFRVHLEKFPVEDVIHSALDGFADRIDTKHIKLELKVNPRLQVLSDPEMMLVIARNLISNAIKFSPREGRVIVGAQTLSGGGVEITVQDFGSGMDPQVQTALQTGGEFRSRRGTEGERGIGIGLRLVRHFCVLLEGELMIESKENVGTCMRAVIGKA